MYKIIDTSENNFRVIDKNGKGVATFYDKINAEEYVSFVNEKESRYEEFIKYGIGNE